jgi:hypothetical protein
MLQFMLQTATSVLFVFQWFTRINGKSARHGRNIDRRICLQTLPCPPSVLGRQSRARQQSQQYQDWYMHLMYVDESGDSGTNNSPTRYFVLSGLVVHELRWHETLNRLVAFRRRMRTQFGLQMREEIHAGPMLTNPGKLARIPRNNRRRQHSRSKEVFCPTST